MSRSRKKHPVQPIAGCKSRTMKWYKTACNRDIRKADEEIPNGGHYKRMNGKHYSRPDDGKMYLSPRDRKKYPMLYAELEHKIYRK